MNNIPHWITILAALLTPIIAIFGLLIAGFQLRNNIRLKENALFDRRYVFYQRVRNYWLETAREDNPEPSYEDLIPVAEEASFIFGKDISSHILSLADKRHTGSPCFPDEDFVKPFRKYLVLK